MTESAVRLGDAGELFLSGVLDYRSGPDLRKQGQALINSSNDKPTLLDFSTAEQSTTTDVALLALISA